LARNNIHPNNKQKPEITNKNTMKRTCQYSQDECESCPSVKVVSKLRSWFHLHFQVLWLMSLL